MTIGEKIYLNQRFVSYAYQEQSLLQSESKDSQPPKLYKKLRPMLFGPDFEILVEIIKKRQHTLPENWRMFLEKEI